MQFIQKITDSIVKNRQYHFWIFLLIIACLTSFMMLFYRPICLGSDPFFNHNRILVLMEALKDGSFPFYLDYNSINGYGYFVKAFYCDLLLIPYAIIGNLTNINIAYDVLIFSITIFCGIFTYITVKRIYGGFFCATVVAILYTFAADRIYMIYYFNTVAEFVSFTFIPLVFLGLYEITKGNYKKWYILTIAFSLIIFTHLLTTVLTFITLLIFVIIYYRDFWSNKQRFFSLIYAGLACLIVCGYYLFPMLEQKFSNSFYFQTHPHMFITGNLVPFSRIFTDMTNNLPNINHSNYYPKMGGLLTVMICLRIFISKKSQLLRSVDIAVIVGLIYIATSLINFPWLTFPFSKLIFIQFPWRLLKFSSLFFAIAGGYYLAQLINSNNRKIIIIVVLSAFLIITLKIDSFDYRTMTCTDCNQNFDEETIAQNAPIGGGAEYLPSRIPSYMYIMERGNKIKKEFDENQLSNYQKKNGEITFDINIRRVDSLELPLTYYLGYKAVLNNHTIPLTQSENGLVQIPVDQSGYVKVWYAGTIVQKISIFITVLGVLLIILYIFQGKRKKYF